MSARQYIGALAALATGAFFWLTFEPEEAVMEEPVVLAGATMGTTWQVQLGGATGPDVRKVLQDAIAPLLQRLDREVFSTWTADSELSRLNRSQPGHAQVISPELLDVLLQAQEIHRLSDGAFDITVGPLVGLWGFGPDAAAELPDEAALAAARDRLGMAALELDVAAGTATFRKPLLLDLSGIAKGYAVDRVATLLQEAGVTDYLVEVGGELRMRGRRADGRAWIVAVEKPHAGRPEVFARLDSLGEPLALAGAGDYRNFREHAGVRYSHEIDPRSGRPVTHDLASVTVLHESAALADAWATALMVLGPEAGPVVAAREAIAAYFIIRDPSGLLPRHTGAFYRYLIQQ